MSKALPKKAMERRKKPRGKRSDPKPAPKLAKTARTSSQPQARGDCCKHCAQGLESESKALFVEEEVGRIFCSEECITAFFLPEIEKLERSYFNRLSSNDLSGEDREKYAHLRWVTLEEPDEVWREKTLAGDFRYTLISEFSPDTKPVWCVCICLFLRGEPSFLFQAFPTRNAAMANAYRRGERIQWARPKRDRKKTRAMQDTESGSASNGPSKVMDGLADGWSEDETRRAQINQGRRTDDIPSSEFDLYQGCLEETLETPDEVWVLSPVEPESMRLYHFIRFYPEGTSGVWYVIVAKETEDAEQIELLDAFPTRDPDLVERFRRGDQEVGEVETPATSRLVH